MKLSTFWSDFLDRYGKLVVYNHLRQMSHRQLEDCGFSPELLREGVSAWPWRALPDDHTPLQIDEALNLNHVSEKTELSVKPAEKSMSLQRDAA